LLFQTTAVMKAVWLLLLALVCILSFSIVGSKKHDAVVEDNDFAEFEDFEDEEGNCNIVYSCAVIFYKW